LPSFSSPKVVEIALDEPAVGDCRSLAIEPAITYASPVSGFCT
jgi:hypothetical protein